MSNVNVCGCALCQMSFGGGSAELGHSWHPAVQAVTAQSEAIPAASQLAVAELTATLDAQIQAQSDTSLIRLDQFRADPRFSGIDGRGVSVVVLDTGIDLNHSSFGPDANFNGVADRIVYSYDFSGSNDSNASDTNGHGSNVASIIGSQDPTFTGMAPGVNIIALKVFPDGSNPGASNADIAEALNWVVANRAAYNIVAVNMSLGSFSNYNSPVANPYGSQFATLAANNTAVVVASGNYYASFQTAGVSGPSADPNAWSIGAVWDRNTGSGYQWSSGSIDYTTGADRIISFSQRSPTMTTIFAPGGQITGANYNGGYSTYSGTSQAAPHIAGLVADMQQLALQVSGHLLSVSQLKQEMINGSVSIYDGDDENDNVANTLAYYRRVDAVGWGTQVLNDLFAGTAGNDTLNGTAAGDTIHGGDSDDVLSGNAGNDVLFGDAGNDTLNGGTGDDTIDGGAGVDTAVFSGLRSAYEVDWDFDFIRISKLGDSDTLFNIENVNFSDGVVAVEALGPPPVLIEALGSTRLVEVNNRYFLRDTGGSGPSLKFGGTPFTEGRFGAWAPIATEQTGSGYQVAIKFGAADQYQVWNVDAAGNFLGAAIGSVSGSDMGLQVLELAFQQDLNGNGTIGPATTTIESFGSTRLVEVGNQYFLRDTGGSGPSLKFGGTPFTEGRFGAWAPIATEQTGSGYQVAIKFGAADQYQVWNVDAAGNFLGAAIGSVSGSDMGLQVLELAFQQDLNGNGTIGPVTTTIENFGVTHLDLVGNQYFLRDTGGSGPSLKFGGTPFTEGRFGAWAPIAAERATGGLPYAMVLKNGAADEYQVWSVDSNGNFAFSDFGTVPGSDLLLEYREPNFQQDLNGDGQIGPVTTTIESFGSTRLSEFGNQYTMQDSSGAGAYLLFQGTPFTEGRFGAWTPIGAEKTANGFQVAIKFGAADLYQVWNVDNIGNFVNAALGSVPGSNGDLQAMELAFQQDLNGDAQIGSMAASGVLQIVEAIAAFDPGPAGQATLAVENVGAMVPMLATNLDRP